MTLTKKLDTFLNNNTFPTLFNEEFLGVDPKNFNPRANVVDLEKSYSIEIEIPGVKKDEVEITFKNNVLKVKGEKKNEVETNHANHYSFESSYGMFERSWVVRDVDESKIDANFDSGVLKITLPKKDEVIKKSEVKRIPIK